jgi:hypothetical protein
MLDLRYVYDEYHNKMWADPQYATRGEEAGNGIALMLLWFHFIIYYSLFFLVVCSVYGERMYDNTNSS